MKRTFRKLWEQHQGLAIREGIDTPREIALQQAGFLSGCLAVHGLITQGGELDFANWQEFSEEITRNLLTEIDRVFHLDLGPSKN